MHGTQLLRTLVSQFSGATLGSDGKLGIVEPNATSEAESESRNLEANVRASPATANLRCTGTQLHYVELEVVNGTTLARITKEDIRSEIEFWTPSIYCQVLGAHPPYTVINGYLRRIWKERGIDRVLRVDKGLFLVRFKAI